jgi:hypothetical protein
MTPQEVHRVAFPCNEQHSDAIEKHSEVHGHLLEPEVIINVKQEPQVKRKFTATLLEGAGRIISVLPPPSWQFILKLVHARTHTHTPTHPRTHAACLVLDAGFTNHCFVAQRLISLTINWVQL